MRPRNLIVTLAVLAAGLPGRAVFSGELAPGPQAYQDSYDLEARGAFDGALVALRKAPASEQTTYVFKLRQAWLQYLTGRHDAAIGTYRQAIALMPKAVEPRLGLMLPQIALRRWLDVEKSAREVLAMDPKNYLASSRLAWALYNLGRYPEAEKQYRAVLDGYPSDIEMQAGLGWSLLQAGQGEAAAGIFTQVLRVAPRHRSAADGVRAARQD
jgi:tetratricopeptide (TPR) repeat protein